jgi:hypothetical protein
MTLSIIPVRLRHFTPMTFSIKTLSIMALCIMTLGVVPA